VRFFTVCTRLKKQVLTTDSGSVVRTVCGTCDVGYLFAITVETRLEKLLRTKRGPLSLVGWLEGVVANVESVRNRDS
jgi:hypothetical protein